MDGLIERANWVNYLFTFRGDVQMVAFRRRILLPIHRLNLAGQVANDQYDSTIVTALLGGPQKAMNDFRSYCKESICGSGVEMEVEGDPTLRSVLPLPAVRIPNSGEDIEDRFDKAIDLLTEMRDGINEIKENTSVIPEMNEKTSKILDNTTEILTSSRDIQKSNKHISSTVDQILDTSNEILDSNKQISSTVDEILDTSNEILVSSKHISGTVDEILVSNKKISGTVDRILDSNKEITKSVDRIEKKID
jgi:acylphosphatase